MPKKDKSEIDFCKAPWVVIGMCFLLLLSQAYSITFTNSSIIDWDNDSYEGQNIVIDGCTLTINGEHAFESLAIINGGLLRHSAAPNGETKNRLSLNISSNVTIDSTSNINCDGLGYGTEQGPGAGETECRAGGGAGYGGKGGDGYARFNPDYPYGSFYYCYPSGGIVYGDLNEPIYFGSGGGGSQSSGGAGGGSIKLVVGETLQLDGTISANGRKGTADSLHNYAGGGGSGGSVWIIAHRWYGSGSIFVNGGNGGSTGISVRHQYEGGGGGSGGRVALYSDYFYFSGNVTVSGGTSDRQNGRIGTIKYFLPPEQIYGPIPPTYPGIATDLSSYENIVFITHGWNGYGEVPEENHGWIDIMLTEFQDYFNTNEMSETWTCYAYNWEEYAGDADVPQGAGLWETARATLESLETSRGNAIKIGHSIGTQLSDLNNCKHIHLIAHSAGSWMIDTISEKIKYVRPDISVQITFLDTYIPGGTEGIDTLGQYGDWVEQYVDNRNDLLFINLTNGTLKSAYNIDVTFADSVYDRPGSVAHGWPIDWYLLSIPDMPPLDYASRGFSFSLEGGLLQSLDDMQQIFPRGDREVYPPDFELPPAKNPVKEFVSNAVSWLNNALNYSSPDDVEFNKTRVTMNSGEFSQSLKVMNLAAATTESTSEIPTDISWFSTSINVNKPVNALSFSSEFINSTGTESILEVYWKDQLIGSIDQRYVFEGSQAYIYFLPQIYQPGSYKLAFKLATYNNTASSIEIDNLRLKLYRASYDLYPDNKIDLLDFAILANEWSLEKMSEDLSPSAGDGIINMLDFAVLASSWGEDSLQDMQRLQNISKNWLVSYELPTSDIAPYPNGDGVVDWQDLQLLAEHWLEGN